MVKEAAGMTAKSFSDPAAGAFREEARAWLAANAGAHPYDPDAPEPERIRVRRVWEKALTGAGFNCLTWPVRYGGRGAGPVEDFIFAEESIAAHAPEPLGRIGRLLTAPGLMVHGTDAQKQRFLPPIMNCDDIWCQGFSEPNAGSDLAALRTTARREGDRYIINGQKIWTTVGHYADRCLLLARTGEPGGRHKGLTMFALPMDQPGVTVRQIRQISGHSDFNEVYFEDAEVSVEDMIGAEGDGWKVAMTVLMAERGAGFAALRLQMIRDQLDLLHRTPAEAVGVRRLAEFETRFDVLSWQVRRAVEKMASDRNPMPSSGVLKLIWSELEQDITRAGVLTSPDAHLRQWRFYEMNARAQSIASGTSEIQRNIIAERVLGLPK